MGRLCTAGVIVGVVAAVLAAPAQAAFPGQNGKLAYESGDDGDWDIYVVNQDGTGKEQLTHNTVLDREPAWSPDGSQLAFICCSAGSTEVWVMSATGTNRVQLTDDTGFVQSLPGHRTVRGSRSRVPIAIRTARKVLSTSSGS
jgi:hypothetical protein